MTYLLNNSVDIIAATINKKITPINLRVGQGSSVWLGGLARLDFMSGDDKNFSFFFSQNVTVHKTYLLNAPQVFAKHIGTRLRPVLTHDLEQLDLVGHVFNLECNKQTVLNYDVVIAGFGWFSVSGNGFVQFELYLPRNVTVYLRKKPLMPYEIQKAGLLKQTGKTYNMNSKINRQFSNNQNSVKTSKL